MVVRYFPFLKLFFFLCFQQIQCRQMGFLGNLKWVGKDKQEAGAEMDEVQAALEVYGKADSAKKRQ